MSTDFGFLTPTNMTDVTMNGTLGAPDFLSADPALSGAAGDFYGNGVATDYSEPPVPQEPIHPKNAPGKTEPATSAPDPKAKVVDYNEAFPALAGDGPGSGDGATAAQASAWTSKPVPRLRAGAIVTQMLHVPAEERHSRDDASFGNKSSEIHECNEIATRTGTKIELCESKDLSLTVMITGKRQAIEEARKQIAQQIQRQDMREIRIPKEHHRILIGREGKKLAELEAQTHCRILLPQRDAQSEVIRVSGPKEGIEAALHHIQNMSDEQSKLAQQHLIIPRAYYPWIKGPSNENVDDLKRRTGARVNIPPPSASSEIIVVTGEKEGVYQAAEEIRQIYEKKLACCQTLTIPLAKSQHKYVIGPGGSAIADILRETDVSVEIPPTDSEDATVTLRGEADKLGQAVSLVYAKGGSVVTAKVACPQWLHKFVIGTRGANIKQVVGEPPRVQVDFCDDDDEDCILIEGKPEDVRAIKTDLSEVVEKLRSHYATVTLHVPPTHHRHVIGRAGSNIQKIKEQTGVLVNIPDESTNSDEIRLEGPKEGVAQASAMIKEIADRLENERSRDILIDQRFHSLFIGAKGAGVKDLREKYPGVNVSFPEPGRKSDIVSLRGPKEEVDALYKELHQRNKKLVEDNHQVKVHVYKDYHGAIIGKGGQNLRKIRDETETKIEIPPEGSGTDVILITGKKPNAERAAEMLQKMQNELASIVTLELKIPNNVHSSLLYGGGKLIHSIQDDCGGAQIKFPDAKANSDKVVIRGPKEQAERAKVLLSQLAKDRELSSFKADVKVKAEHHRFLIGSGGQAIKKIRDKFPDVRIMFPRQSDEDKDTVHLIGRKEDVTAVKNQLESMAKDLDNVVEQTVEIDPKYHGHFFQRQFAVLKDVQEECGGVVVSFPRRQQGKPTSATVSVKGAKDCVDAAILKLKQIIDDLVSQVTIEAEVAQRHHRSLFANRGALIQEICAECNVQIKFPERSPPRNSQPPRQNGEPKENGHGEPEPAAEEQTGPRKEDIVLITGRKENCEKAKAMLEAAIPVAVEVTVPFDYHRFLIGKAGADLRQLQNDHNVNVSIPPREEQRDSITVNGPPENVKKATAAILARVAEFDEEAKEKELKSHAVVFDVPEEYVSRIIGPKGKTIREIRDKHDVQIKMPLPNGPNPNQVTVTGFEANAEAAKKDMLDMIQELEALFTQEITLDMRVHPRLIGQRGKAIRKIMDDYNVEVKFPRGQTNPNLVVVVGAKEDDVYDCIDYLRNLEEEYLQDTVDRYRHPKYEERNNNVSRGPGNVGVTFANAPWNAPAPDTTNTEDFPAMGGGPGAAAASPATAWGPRR